MDSSNQTSNCPIHSPVIRRTLILALIALAGGAIYYWYLSSDTGPVQPMSHTAQQARQRAAQQTTPASTNAPAPNQPNPQ